MNINDLFKCFAKSRRIPTIVKTPILILSSWVFQGLLYMGLSEKILKLSIDILLTIIGYYIIFIHFSFYISILLSIVFVHTVNWLINGQIFVLLKNLNLVNIEKEKFSIYLDNLKLKAEKSSYISSIAVYGSLSRGCIKSTSDLDVRVIRKKGLINCIKSCIFIVKERFMALLNRFPLDIYLIDNINDLKIMGEPPIIIYDVDNLFKK